jgi:hypothetical protein
LDGEVEDRRRRPVGKGRESDDRSQFFMVVAPSESIKDGVIVGPDEQVLNNTHCMLHIWEPIN